MSQLAATPTAAAIFAALACSGCGSAPPVHALRVVSSISDGAALSDPVEWSATAVGVARRDRVARVEFVIDGRLRWTDRTAPYFFNDDHRLYPWTLGSGPHTVAVRLVTTGHRPVSTSSQVAIARRPPAPHALVHAYVRRSGATVRFTSGGVVSFREPPVARGVQAFTGGQDGSLILQGSANWLAPAPAPAALCSPHAGAGVYRWSFERGVLELRARNDPCRRRKAIFDGRWAVAH